MGVPTYRLYGEAEPSDADFWLHFEELPVRSRPSRWEIRRHRHGGFFQIFNISHGGGELLGEHGTQRFEAPAAIVIPTGTVHGFRFAHDSDGMVLTIRGDRLSAVTIADRRLAAFFDAPRVVPLGGTAPETVRALEALQRIRAELSGRAAGRMALVGALIVDVLINLGRTGADAAAPPPDGRDGERLEQLAELVATHFREHRPVSFYAERLGISPTHLNRIARTRLGASVQRLLDGRLLAEARRELLFSPRPAKAVAFSLGFSDPAYFNRFFRKHTGTTPGRFRAAERGGAGG